QRWFRRSKTGRAPTRTASAESLRQHSALFTREVIEVVPGVHVAVGFGLANAILIEGEDGVIIVDTMESEAAAQEVKAAFCAITSKPVRAIIYTHNHTDHIFGGHVMAGDDDPEVISHATTPEKIRTIVGIMRPTIVRRSLRQFGTLLDPADRPNCGIGPELRFDPNEAPRLLWPTVTFEDRLERTIAGVRLELIHAPGETPDQIAIWLPDHRALLPADNIYQTFPNLYAIRGTAYRDVMAWVRTLDILRAFQAEHLIPCHTRPLSGADRIETTLRNYRDAIQFVHDQTIRRINQGMPLDAIVQAIQLPPHLAADPWLQEHYGRVDWSVRAIYHGYLGWFEEDAAFLSPLPAAERATRMERLVGGRDLLLKAAREAIRGGDLRWGLELLSHLLTLEPTHDEGRQLRAQALRGLAAEETSANGRNYYLTQALEATGDLTIPKLDPSISARRLLDDIPVDLLMRSMPPSLDADACLDDTIALGLYFTDTDQAYSLTIRRGVAELAPRHSDTVDARLTTTTRIWKELLTGMRNPGLTLAGPQVTLEGSRTALVRALLWFKPA
ncbi:MAG: alkyl sulfatase dimerization domain-containing protein, partial [Myxococcota bacterium]